MGRTAVTFQALLALLRQLEIDPPDREALDRRVIVRICAGELYVGVLTSLEISCGCTETFALVLDADQEPEDPEATETFRTLLARLGQFEIDRPDHESLDRRVVVRIQTSEDQGDDLYVGGLTSCHVGIAGDDPAAPALVLDADQEPDGDLDTAGETS